MQELFERAFVAPFEKLTQQFESVVEATMTVVVILVVGGVLAWTVRQVLYRLLKAAQFDRLAESLGFARTIERTQLFRSASDFAARVAEGFVWLVIVLFALNAVNTEMTDNLVARFVNYVPDILTSILVLLLGSVISRFLARSVLLAAVNEQWAGARLLAGGVRMLVMMLAVVIALGQLQIGREPLLTAFAILFGGIVVAAAIAFGLGARDMAREWLQSKIKGREPEQEEEVLRHL